MAIRRCPCGRTLNRCKQDLSTMNFVNSAVNIPPHRNAFDSSRVIMNSTRTRRHRQAMELVLVSCLPMVWRTYDVSFVTVEATRTIRNRFWRVSHRKAQWDGPNERWEATHRVVYWAALSFDLSPGKYPKNVMTWIYCTWENQRTGSVR